MAMKRCPVCGEKYSDTYRYCPFCEEADLDQEEDPRRAPGRSGRRVGVGSPRRPNLMTPVLVVLILLMAALLVYLLWGDKFKSGKKNDEPEDKPGIEDIKPDQKDPAAQDPAQTDPATDPDAQNPDTQDPDAQEPGGEIPEAPVTDPSAPDTSYETASALPGGLTLTNVSGNDFTRSVSEGAYRLKVSGGSGTYTWISEDPGIASVDSEGSVTPISAGVTHVLATDGSKKVICTVRVVGGGTTTTTTPATPSTGTDTTPTTGGSLRAGAATVINGGNGVRVRSGPGTNYDILATVPNGGSVQVVQSAGDGWYEITFSNVGGVKTTGYMKGEYLSN